MEQTLADIKSIRAELIGLKTDLLKNYSTPQAYYARIEHKKDALQLSEMLGVLQSAVFICELYETVIPLCSLHQLKTQVMEDLSTMMFRHEGYLGNIVTFCEPIDTIQDPKLRKCGDQMMNVIMKLIQAIDTMEAELQ